MNHSFNIGITITKEEMVGKKRLRAALSIA
jgi:hypothetical protein